MSTFSMHFAATSIVPGLLPNKQNVWNNIITTITTYEVILDKIKFLKYNAAAAKELDVMSHDVTFRTLFCFIDQKHRRVRNMANITPNIHFGDFLDSLLSLHLSIPPTPLIHNPSLYTPLIYF